jgi:hypothetical protein
VAGPAPAATPPKAAFTIAPPTINRLPAGGVDLGVRARQDLDAFVARSRVDLATALDATDQPVLTLRVHESAVAYERATGLPWFTQAALRRGELHLMPIGPLNESGMLERVVRRELVHAFVDEPLNRRPRWVKDGAALYFADPERSETATDVHALCPTDAELQNPVSAGALSTAYARARACFSRQIAAGRTWREVR